MSYSEKAGKNTWRVRYLRDDGTLGTISGFPTESAANHKAQEIDADRRRGTFQDPEAGKITLAEWAPTWYDSIEVAPATEAQYRSLGRNHILPRWGSVGIGAIAGVAVKIWAKQLRANGYAESTVSTIVKILSMMLADATDERLIVANPIRANRRGRRRRARPVERQWTTPERALLIALQAGQLSGLWATALLITAAWTGARWGELTGLQRHNLHLDDGCFDIDPDIGALHEINGRFELGPPKTIESARTVTLSPFLVDIIRTLLDTTDHPHVFVTADGELLRRSNFSRRVMRPAADGNLQRPRATIHVHPVVPGLTFHGLRHSHKTWMIADGLPQVAQAKRLGHRIPDKIEHIYSHVAPEVEARLHVALQRRWADAVNSLTDHTTASDTADTHLPRLQALIAR
jgi:integrase